MDMPFGTLFFLNMLAFYNEIKIPIVRYKTVVNMIKQTVSDYLYTWRAFRMACKKLLHKEQLFIFK